MLQPIFQLETEREDDNYARLAIEPLEKGFGHTLGVSLRRVLLSSIEGAAVTSVRIDGVQHQYSTMSGMKEDVVELLLNIKELRFSMEGTEDDEVTAKLSASGETEVTGADIDLPAGVELANPEMVLATLGEKKSSLDLEMTVSRGRGYVMADEQESSSLGMIMLDASFSPVTKVAYKITATRVGRQTDFDKLLLDVWTDGTIEPEDAVKKASKILVAHFKQVYDPVIVETEPVETLEDRMEDETLRLTVEELDLPTRIANALRKGGYTTVKDLTQATREDIEKVKNLGEKSVQAVAEALEKKGVAFKGEAQPESEEAEDDE